MDCSRECHCIVISDIAATWPRSGAKDHVTVKLKLEEPLVCHGLIQRQGSLAWTLHCASAFEAWLNTERALDRVPGLEISRAIYILCISFPGIRSSFVSRVNCKPSTAACRALLMPSHPQMAAGRLRPQRRMPIRYTERIAGAVIRTAAPWTGRRLEGCLRLPWYSGHVTVTAP